MSASRTSGTPMRTTLRARLRPPAAHVRAPQPQQARRAHLDGLPLGPRIASRLLGAIIGLLLLGAAALAGSWMLPLKPAAATGDGGSSSSGSDANTRFFRRRSFGCGSGGSVLLSSSAQAFAARSWSTGMLAMEGTKFGGR